MLFRSNATRRISYSTVLLGRAGFQILERSKPSANIFLVCLTYSIHISGTSVGQSTTTKTNKKNMKEEKSKDEPQLYDDDDEVEEDDEKKTPIEPSKGQTTSLNSAALTPPPTFHRREYNRVRKTDKSLSSSSTPSSSFASNDQIANIPEKVAAANQLTGPSHNVSLAFSSSPDQPAFHRREYNRARARKIGRAHV